MKTPITWPQVALAAIVVPSVCLLLYGLVMAGEDVAKIAAGVVAIVAAMGWQASRTKAQLGEVRADVGTVKDLANGNLSREVEARAAAQQQQIDQMHAVYQQMLQLAAMTPTGTVVPPLPSVPVVRPLEPDPAHIPPEES